jgi:hypothetical protein
MNIDILKTENLFTQKFEVYVSQQIWGQDRMKTKEQRLLIVKRLLIDGS